MLKQLPRAPARERDLARQQVEHPDNWLRYHNPWEFARPEVLYHVKFHGRVIEYTDAEKAVLAPDEDNDRSPNRGKAKEEKKDEADAPSKLVTARVRSPHGV